MSRYLEGMRRAVGPALAPRPLASGSPEPGDPNWIPDDSWKAIHAPTGSKIREIRVNAYWRDFQRGLAKAADEYAKTFLI